MKQMFQNAFKGEGPTEIKIQKYMESDQASQSIYLPCSSITLFILLGFIFILIGIFSLVSNYQQNLVEIELKQTGQILSTVQTYLSFSSDNTLEVYLKIQKLTQFDYFISDADSQSYIFAPNRPTCGNYKYNKDLNKRISVNGSSLNLDDTAIPCGFFPAMFPQGNITITLDGYTNISLDQSDLIYFPYQIDQGSINQAKAWVNTSDPFFQAWISQNAAITTTKLIGKLVGKFQGYFAMNIHLKNAFPVELGKASIILSPTKAFGSSNLPFCATNFCQSGVLFIFAFIVYFYNKIINDKIKSNKIQSKQFQLKSQSEEISVKSGDI